MSPRVRTALALLLLAVAAAALVFWTWLPFDPFEGPAPRLDALVPADADAAFRCDGAALLSSPFVAALAEREDLADLRERIGLGEGVTSAVRRIEAAFSQGAEAVVATPTFARDLVPAEVVVATRGADVLVLSRISSRARAIELLRREDPESLRALGLRLEGQYVALLGDDGSPRLWAARHRDALLVGTSQEIVSTALTLGETEGGGLSRAPGFDDALALGGGAPCGERAFLWATPRALRRWTEGFGDAAWRSLVAQEGGIETLRLVAEVRDRGRLTAEASVAWSGDSRPRGVASFDVGAAARGPLALEGGPVAKDAAVVEGGLGVRAADVLEMLLRSSPAEVEGPAADAFEKAGESPASVARALAEHLDDGVSLAVVRLAEADQLGADDAEPGAVRAIPATVVAFRMKRGAAGAEALDAEIARLGAKVVGEPLGDVVHHVAPGVRVHEIPRRGLGGHWALLSPAFAFAGDSFLVSSNTRFLRAALSGGAAEGRASGARVAVRLDAPALRRLVEDSRFEEADRATGRDWSAERREVEAAAESMSFLGESDRRDYVDLRMRERAARRRRVDVPRAAEEARARWRWLGAFADATVQGDIFLVSSGSTARSEARLHVEVRLAE